MIEGELYTGKELLAQKKMVASKPNTLQITSEAQEALLSQVREGYSRKRLASEAIIEKYGKHPGKSAAEAYAERTVSGVAAAAVFAERLIKRTGSAKNALTSLAGYIDYASDPAHYAEVAERLIELAKKEGT